MFNWLKWITHRKEYVLHENGTWKCACGHPKNQHIPRLYCATGNCQCYNATYFYEWVPRSIRLED